MSRDSASVNILGTSLTDGFKLGDRQDVDSTTNILGVGELIYHQI